MVEWWWLLVVLLGAVGACVGFRPAFTRAMAMFRAWREADDPLPGVFTTVGVSLVWLGVGVIATVVVYIATAVLVPSNVAATLDNVSKMGPLATVAAAVVAGLFGAGAVLQKRATDRRDHWWKRAEWALTASFSDDPERRDAGLAALRYQVRNAPSMGEAWFLKSVTADDKQDLIDALGKQGINLGADDVFSDELASTVRPERGGS